MESLRLALRAFVADGFASLHDASKVAVLPALAEEAVQWLEARSDAPAPLVAALRSFAIEASGFDALGREDRARSVATAWRALATWAPVKREEAVPVHKPRRADPATTRAPRRVTQPSAQAPAEIPTQDPPASPSRSRAPAAKSLAAKPQAAKPQAAKPQAAKPPGSVGVASSRGPSAAGTGSREGVSSSGAPHKDPGIDGVESLRGVGAGTAAKLRSAGLHTIEDLAFLLPAGYEERRQFPVLLDVQDGTVVPVRGIVRSYRQGYLRGGRFLATLVLDVSEAQGEGTLEVRWFHPVHGLAAKVMAGTSVVATGPLKVFRGVPSMTHAEVVNAEDFVPGLHVRYPVIRGVGQRTLAKLCQAALEQLRSRWPEDAEILPAELRQRHGLLGRFEALQAIHMPPSDLPSEALRALAEGTAPAYRTLAFEELFFVQLELARTRAAWKGQAAPVQALADEAVDPEKLRASVPFEPTPGQWQVIREIEADLRSGRPMLRLVQGDVGSGKTLVAFATAQAVVAAGAQVALMAPTEILALQHERTLRPWGERAGIRIACLTASTPAPRRATIVSLLGAGQIDLVIGTHALLSQGVGFAELGLVVIDEQHRFGVEQRALLRDKGRSPHLLVMTATPIPRTLALTAFGELDVSVIEGLPAGRKPGTTVLHAGPRGLAQARERLVGLVRQGHSAFVVVPLVEASETLEVSDVEATAEALRELLPEHRVGIVHGRVSARERDETMAAFRDGQLNVLVATTVIEVGVDIPEASVILVEHAERFGLAQLHQLRGRVGRGEIAGTCILHTSSGPRSETATRLQVLVETNDGFRIAERDLVSRGPGEIFGTRQAGAPRLRFLSFGGEGTKLLVVAREAARDLVAKDPDLRAYPAVRAELEKRRSERGTYAGEAG